MKFIYRFRHIVYFVAEKLLKYEYSHEAIKQRIELAHFLYEKLYKKLLVCFPLPKIWTAVRPTTGNSNFSSIE